MSRFGRAASAVFVGLFLAGSSLPAVPGHCGEPAKSPGFGVTIPEGYRGWEVVAPSHRVDKDELRVILGNGIAMTAYRAGTLPFPDGSILAKLAWKRVKSPTFDPAYVPGDPQRIEFMVKDSKRYASTGGWGFGRFVGGKAANEEQHGTCFPCHRAGVPGNDFVFTRYAP